MYKGLLFLCLLFSACSAGKSSSDNLAAQQDTLFRRDAKSVLAEVDSMFEADQAIRRAYEYGNTPARVADSLDELDFGSDMKAFYEAQKSFKPGARFQDSVNTEMIAQDARHTARIVALTARYGYPSSHRLDSTTNIDPFILFHHPSPRYKDTVLALLTRELQLGRIDSPAFNMIRWSYNGRVGLPEGVRVTKVDTMPDGTKMTSIEIQ